MRSDTTLLLTTLTLLLLACAPARIGDPGETDEDGLLDDGANNASSNNAANNSSASNNAAANNAAPNNADPNNSAPNNADTNNSVNSNPNNSSNNSNNNPNNSAPNNSAPNNADPNNSANNSDPCSDVQCSMFASCDAATGACACDPGFEQRGEGCVAPNPGDPATRSEQEVCERFAASNAAIVAPMWTPGADPCEPGVFAQESIDSGVERINFYRWLNALSPLDDLAELNEATQACAVIQRAQGGLNHNPPPNTPCYTELGAAAAAHSNIAGSYPTASSAVDGFMEDRHTDVLGHRRWILFPPFGYTGFGYVTGYYCQWVDWGRSVQGAANPEFVAFPNAGYTPAALIPPTWSFASSVIGFSAETTATRIDPDGTETPLETYLPDPRYGQPAVGFRPGAVQAGQDVQIRLDNVRIANEMTSLTYTVRPTTCN